MSISSVITLGYGQGAKFIPTLGYLSGTAPAPTGVVLLGGKDYPTHYLTPADRYREEEYHRSIKAKKLALAEVEKEIADAEKRKEKERKAKKAAANAVIEAMLQEEINVLRMERVRLMRLIDDEETILVLLLSLPFH